jgi:hypothetical protein
MIRVQTRLDLSKIGPKPFSFPQIGVAVSGGKLLRTFAPQQSRTPKGNSPSSATTWSKRPQPYKDTHAIPDWRSATGRRFDLDFSRIPVHPHSPDLPADQALQAKAADPNGIAETGIPAIVHQVLSFSGQALDPATRKFMESRFGHDFSQVRVHTDARAAESARAVSANAYTSGQNLVFGAGMYEPATERGRRLLAHELTHVLQQRPGVARGIAGADGPTERAAQEASQAVVSGRPVGPLLAVGTHEVQRAPNPYEAQANRVAVDLQKTIDGAVWKEIRKRVYPKESKAGIERAKARHEGSRTDLSGLGKLSTLDHFAGEVRKLQTKWPSMSSARARVDELGRAASAELVAVDVPGFLIVEKEVMESKAYFQGALWRFAISEALVSGASLSNDDAAQLTNAALHEGRHAEQEFLSARYSAGVLKKTSAEIHNEQHIPQVIADQAVAKKFDANTDAASAQLGQRMYQAGVTEGAANEKIESDTGWAVMAYKRTDAILVVQLRQTFDRRAEGPPGYRMIDPSGQLLGNPTSNKHRS